MVNKDHFEKRGNNFKISKRTLKEIKNLKSSRRGFLRIMEAVIAILIVVGVLILIVSDSVSTNVSREDLVNEINPLLEEVSKNLTLRDLIVEEGKEAEGEIESFLSDKITSSRIGYRVRVCEAEEVCGLGELPEDFDGDIYSEERIIGASLNADSGEFRPKKLKIFVWRKG